MGKAIKSENLMPAAEKGFTDELQSTLANLARTEALLETIGHLSLRAEDSNDGDTFLLATAIQACVESAQREAAAASASVRRVM
ncbi:MAG: hypothetical protein KF891_03980 [Rhizobacter sp.]|nr:hypothetical protein [Rhizobacter sp.]